MPVYARWAGGVVKHVATRTVRPRRTVAAVFVLCVLLFGAVLSVPLYRRDNTAATSPDTATAERYTVLLLIHDSHTLTAAMVLHINTATCAVEAVGYPRQTEVACGTALCTLAECFAAQPEHASRCGAQQPDATLILSVDAVAQLVARLGGLPYTLSEATDTLSGGYQTLGALQVADLLRYTAWSDTVCAQGRIHAELLATLLNRYLTASTDLTSCFRVLTAYSDTHLTVTMWASAEPILRRLATANNGDLCTARVAQGYVTGVGVSERYVVTE